MALDGAAEHQREDHAEQLDEHNAKGHREQGGHVVLEGGHQLFRAALSMNKYS